MKGKGAKKFVLVLGGARSGKSAHAQKLAESIPGPLDAEMAERIEKHRAGRGKDWRSIEEPGDVAGRIRSLDPGGVVLLDCVTLWLSNLLGAGLSDEEVSVRVDELAGACTGADSSIVMVSNDVGSGVVPENRLARRFVDVSGLANQRLAEAATEVYYVTAGIPKRIK
jgi:adenosylcobinamide kinase/adenosylcobinamide-phosphate guanylyltransferase